MAKAFYTQEEAREALATDDDGLKALVDDGRLTEYRDGPNLMYKGSQIEKLQEQGAGGLNPADSGGPIGLADDAGSSASGQSAGGISLSDDSAGGQSMDASVGDEISLADSTADAKAGSAAGSAASASGRSAGASRVPGSSGAPLVSEDTGEFAVVDTNYEQDALTDAGGTGSGGSVAGASQSGITIFEDDEVDPSAQTDIGGSGDQALEGIGSGSGLLDLTQEPDDTSFGAETFDEIMPESSVAGGTVAGADVDGGIDTSAAPAGARTTAVAYEVADPAAPIFGGLALGGALALVVGLIAITLSVLDAGPGILSFVQGDDGSVDLVPALALLAGLPLVGLIVGFVMTKVGQNA